MEAIAKYPVTLFFENVEEMAPGEYEGVFGVRFDAPSIEGRFYFSVERLGDPGCRFVLSKHGRVVAEYSRRRETHFTDTQETLLTFFLAALLEYLQLPPFAKEGELPPITTSTLKKLRKILS
ncbi:MAG: hypothetical protein UY56_C0005G0014 [Parcubacteria group bacterium GW2011_GWA1_50_14]|nr:MAG: hypothetical protein UY56_C0005G0014 [Parcubacteria group bacterium GW2011_GWA1_50_14]